MLNNNYTIIIYQTKEDSEKDYYSFENSETFNKISTCIKWAMKKILKENKHWYCIRILDSNLKIIREYFSIISLFTESLNNIFVAKAA